MTDFYLSIDFSKLTPIEDMFGGDFEETQQLTVLFEEAELYLSSFNWCQGIKSVYFGLGVSDIIGIFLFEILPSESSVDRYFWVVAGDTPPAHLPTVDCPNSVLALDSYIGRTRRWCESVLAGARLEGKSHVNLAQTAANARDLMERVRLLDSVILEHYRQGDLVPTRMI